MKINCFVCGKFKECQPTKIEVENDSSNLSIFGGETHPEVRNVCKKCRKSKKEGYIFKNIKF